MGIVGCGVIGGDRHCVNPGGCSSGAIQNGGSERGDLHSGILHMVLSRTTSESA